jgi:hypothetical protein
MQVGKPLVQKKALVALGVSCLCVHDYLDIFDQP